MVLKGGILSFQKVCLVFCIVCLLPLFVSAISDANLTYDARGNLLSDSVQVYEYNSLNQLVSVKNTSNFTLSSFMYDHMGERVKKIDFHPDGSNTTTYYVNKDFMVVINTSGVFNITYYRAGDVLVAKQENGEKLYYHQDHLGGTNIVTDQNGDVVEETTYYPYGEVLEGGDSRFLFTGKEQDDVGLYYYGARYYSPTTRMFTQADTILPNIYDPQQLNRYSYVRNNPYKYVDPTGNLALAIDFTMFFSQNSLRFNVPAEILGRNDIVPRISSDIKVGENIFRESEIARISKQQGYKFPEEFSEGHPIRNLLDNFKQGGMAKETSSGEWDILRWDIGHKNAPYDYPHTNQWRYKLVEGKPKLVSKGVLDHMGLFSLEIAYTDIASAKVDTNQHMLENTKENMILNYCQTDICT